MNDYSTKFNENKDKLIKLREEGYGYKRIANKLDISRSTVKRWCKRLGLDGHLGTKPVTPKPNGKNCQECNETIVTINQHAKFCCKKCKDKHYYRIRERVQTPILIKKCKVCDESFETNIPNKIYCAEECSKENYREKYSAESFEKTCNNCGNNYVGAKGRTYCSPECGDEYRRNAIKKARPTYNKRCTECGKHYSTTAKLSKYCSPECSRRFNNRKAEVNRREQLKENGKIDWDISIERLIKRDGSECYLCHERCDLNDYEVREDGTFIARQGYPSIDHVVPVAKGGTHTWDNVKLACRRCNTLKSDSLILGKNPLVNV